MAGTLSHLDSQQHSVLREWILKVREVKVKKILFHFLFEKWKVKWKSDSLISRMKSEMQMPWDRDREWKVKWKCIEIEIESEKWNENASRSRSRSEISREFSRNSWESGIFSYLPTVRFQMSLKIAYLSECKFALVTFIWVSPLYVFNLPSDYLFHYEYSNASSNFLPERMQSHIDYILFDLSPLCFSNVSSNIHSKRMHCHKSRIGQNTPHSASNNNILCSQANLGSNL